MFPAAVEKCEVGVSRLEPIGLGSELQATIKSRVHSGQLASTDSVVPGLPPQAEPDPAEHASRYGAEVTVLEWREKLVCFPLRQPPDRHGG